MMQVNKQYQSPHFKDISINVEFLILHYTAQDLRGTLDIFVNQMKPEVSAHLVVDTDGQVYELVKCWDGICHKAYHAGQSYWVDSNKKTWDNFNEMSIGIEMINWNGNAFEYTQKQYESLIQVIRHLQNQYPNLKNPERILGHEHIAGHRGKIDPGFLFDWKKIFQEVYNSPSLLKSKLNKSQSLQLQKIIPKNLNNNLSKKISLLLESSSFFWMKLLGIRMLVFKDKKNQSGQIIVEYVLLLALSVFLALIIVKMMEISNASPFLDFWIKMISVIGEDVST